MADLVGLNRKMVEESLYRVRRIELDAGERRAPGQ